MTDRQPLARPRLDVYVNVKVGVPSGHAIPLSRRPSGRTGRGAPLRIQEAARLVGLTPRAIRHYEQMGLLSPDRSDGAYRLYEAC